MQRQQLLKSDEYWVNEIQNDLYAIIETYMVEKGITRTELASELGVTKGYITQVLNGDFDHKISKMVNLSLAVGKVPLLKFVDLNNFVQNDIDGKSHELFVLTKINNKKTNYKPSYTNFNPNRFAKIASGNFIGQDQ